MNDFKTVLVKGRSGMGNRILAAARGILYAGATQRQLVIDWRDGTYSLDESNVFPRYFDRPSCQPTAAHLAARSVHPPCWIGQLHESALDLLSHSQLSSEEFSRTASADLTRVDYEEDVLVICNHTGPVAQVSPDGRVLRDPARPDSEVAVQRVLRENLGLHPQIRGEIDRFTRELFRDGVIGVHVRYSDKRSRLSAIWRHLRELRTREPALALFLATDNSRVKRLFERSYPRVMTTSHWYAEPGQPIHRLGERPERFQHGIEALRDLYLLSECDRLILDSSSSFARVAAHLARTRTPAPTIIDVNPASHWAQRVEVQHGGEKGDRASRGA